DFGASIIYHLPVSQLLWERGIETLKIQLPGILISLIIAIAIGTIAAQKQYSKTDFTVMSMALLGQSLPGFFLGILLILIFAFELGIFPSYGAYSMTDPLWGSYVIDGLWHMVLPIAMLAFFNTAMLTLLMRSNLVDVLR